MCDGCLPRMPRALRPPLLRWVTQKCTFPYSLALVTLDRAILEELSQRDSEDNLSALKAPIVLSGRDHLQGARGRGRSLQRVCLDSFSLSVE